MRIGKIVRNTNETQIQLELNLDGRGTYGGEMPVGFLAHMLELFCKHGRFDLNIQAAGDAHVDYHHLVEDTGIALGSAFAEALGEMRGIVRYGSFLLPMDEALVQLAADFSGRPYLACGLDIPAQKVGDFDTELVQEFLLGFVRSAGLTLHVRQLAGTNSHHIIEALFKGLGRTLGQAVCIDADYADEIPSTKGML